METKKAEDIATEKSVILKATNWLLTLSVPLKAAGWLLTPPVPLNATAWLVIDTAGATKSHYMIGY